MAEFLDQPIQQPLSEFERMGKPMGENARSEAYKHCKSMGLTSAQSWECVQCMANSLERDEPYEALRSGMRFLDLTGTYRIMAVLLATV